MNKETKEILKLWLKFSLLAAIKTLILFSIWNAIAPTYFNIPSITLTDTILFIIGVNVIKNKINE